MPVKQLLTIIFFLLTTKNCISQNAVVGTWEGRFSGTVTELGEPKLVLEIYDFNDSLFSGMTHLYYDDNKYEHYKVVGKYLRKDSLLVFKEVSTISVDLGRYENCLGIYMAKFKKEGNRLVMTGFWESNIPFCATNAQIRLQKPLPETKKPPVTINRNVPRKQVVTKKPDPMISPKKDKVTSPVLVTPTPPITKNIPAIKPAPPVLPAILRKRETDVQSLIEIAPADKDSIKVEVYDNGEIDGDSVSVYEEHVQRINKKMISTRPITFYVSLNKNINPIVHLRLVAENLGTIPPCTALMIVTTRSRRYEVRLSSNFSKNATVELFLKN